MFWIGSYAAIEAAEAKAAAIVTAIPAYQEGAEVENPTQRWTELVETAEKGIWVLPAYPEMALPNGCSLVETVNWPRGDE